MVLYVDDEKNNRLVFQHTLSKQVRVKLAGSGSEALALLEQEPIQILLTDLRMPGMSGAELAREARERRPGLPVFIVTGYPDDPELREAIARELVQRVFVKPWNPDALLAAFWEVLTPVAP